MRVFITSTPEELEPQRRLAVRAVRDLALIPLLRDPSAFPDLQALASCRRQVARADAVLVIAGHRRGSVPPATDGGDGRHPWAWYETRVAFENKLPVIALLAAADWRQDLREPDPLAGAVMSDFRGELMRLATLFNDGQDFLELVKAVVGGALDASRQRPTITPKRWSPRKLPPRPYPVLLPYAHPELLAGRDRELEEIRRALARPIAVTGLHAPSGAGKSSFLDAGLVAGLRAEQRPVAFVRRPHEPGLVQHLLSDLLEDPPEMNDDAGSTQLNRIVDLLRAILDDSGTPPLLVLDQFEDVLRFPSAERARLLLGRLIAASVQRLPGLSEPPCRWLLVYRQEYHGSVFRWLRDLSVASGDLPRNLALPERFQTWTLSPLGTPAPGSSDRRRAAAEIFRAAIEKPLAHYPWEFANNGAERLARAFAEARVAQRKAPLGPELQVVLAHLLEQSVDGRTMTVPDDAAGLMDSALEEHLRRSLDTAFPVGHKKTSILQRTRALLALRELADVQGQRDDGRPVDVLAKAIGEDGRDVLERLGTPQTRIVLLTQQGAEQVYILSHDRMAEVIVRQVDNEGFYAGLGVDSTLLRLRRFVALQRELFTTGQIEQSTEVPKDHYQKIEEHQDALLWDDEARRWWEHCRERRRRDQRRRFIQRSIAAVLVALITAVVWWAAQRYFERQALLETVAEGEPVAAFKALADLTSANADVQEVRSWLRRREKPFDVVERGLEGVAEEDQGEALVRVVETLVPLQQEVGRKDPEWIASMVWALDFFAETGGRGEGLKERSLGLRNEILQPLRQDHPPPTLAPEDPEWVDIPAGTFMMGSGPGEGRDQPDMSNEQPRHPVQVSAFRMMIHEVTNAEFGRLFPDWAQREPQRAAAFVTWYEAYTYAAWLGGRLPTEAEAEHALRGGCRFTFCKRDGSEAQLGDVAWWEENSADEASGELAAREVMLLEPSPWGLYDIYGNVLELNANWYYKHYPDGLEIDPPGPLVDPAGYRGAKGGSRWSSRPWVHASSRFVLAPGTRARAYGLRVVIP